VRKIARALAMTIILGIIGFSISIYPFSVQALNQYEIGLGFQWSASTYYQGDSGNVIVSLWSDCNNGLKFTWVGIHFQWMAEDYYSSIDLSSNPISIPSKGSCTFPAINFSIPSDAHIGDSEFYVYIQFQEHHSYGRTSGAWKSGTNRFYIHDAYEKVYDDTKPKVDDEINQANLQGEEARSLLQQAINEKDLATRLANQGKWSEAVSHLQTASNLAVQAMAMEKIYQAQKMNTFIVGEVGGAIVVVVIALVLLRRGRRSDSSTRPIGRFPESPRFVSVQCRDWKDFRAKSRGARRIAFEVEEKIFTVNSLSNEEVFKYSEVLAEHEFRAKKEEKGYLIEKMFFDNLDGIPLLFKERLRCGLGISIRSSKFTLPDGEYVFKLAYYVDSDEVKHWLSEQLEIPEENIVEGKITF